MTKSSPFKRDETTSTHCNTKIVIRESCIVSALFQPRHLLTIRCCFGCWDVINWWSKVIVNLNHFVKIQNCCESSLSTYPLITAITTLTISCSLCHLESEYADPLLILCSSRQFFSCLRIEFSKSLLFLVCLEVAISWHHLSNTVNPSIDHPCNFGEALSALLSVYLLLMTFEGLGIFQ